jgi:hypothetical protein
MMKYVVCGSSVEDVEAGVEALKMAVASGATCGVGGSTMAEVEQGMAQLRQMGVNIDPSQMGRDCLRSPNGCCPYCKDEDEDEEIGFCDGYMALSEIGEELSGLCDTPGEAMVDAIGEGYDLGEIGIYAVRVYDDDTVETTATIHRPIK